MWILAAGSNIDQAFILQFDYGNYKGYVAENFVAQEMRDAGVNNLLGGEGRTSEVEFLLETPSGIVPMEVKSGWVTKSKSLKVYTERYCPQQSIILSAENVKTHNARLYVPVYAVGLVVKLLLRQKP